MSERTCSVEGCDKQTYGLGLCAMHKRRVEVHGDPGGPEPLFQRARKDDDGNRLCRIDGCDKRAKGDHSVCSMHAARISRHGNPDTVLTKTVPVRRATNGYLIVRVPGHPLANGSGLAYQHRVVLYGVIGPGDHLCHWCNRAIRWDDRTLQVDHVDEDKHNNAPGNLVPSCQRCNSARSHPKPRRTACSNGHEYTPENTIWTTNGRRCRTCQRAARARYEQKRRAR